MVKTRSFLQLRQPCEIFAVSGIYFYTENMPENFPGYCLTGDTGTRLKSVITGDGQRLRVTDVPDWPYGDGPINAIVRIEALPEQEGAA